MPNPLHTEFMALVADLGGAEHCQRRFNIAPRTMQRFMAGSKPPPNRLIDEMQDAKAHLTGAVTHG